MFEWVKWSNFFFVPKDKKEFKLVIVFLIFTLLVVILLAFFTNIPLGTIGELIRSYRD